MYTMTLDGNPFFDPRVEEYALEDPIIDREANRIARLTFTIYPDHPSYSAITLLSSVIRVYCDGTLMIVMRPIKRTREMLDGVEYECEEWMGTLRDRIERPLGIGTVNNLWEQILDSMYTFDAYNPTLTYRHNPNYSHVTTAHNSDLADENKKLAIEGYKTTWENVTGRTVNKFDDLYLFASYRENFWSINCLTEVELPTGEQSIEFGDNMKALFIEAGGDDFFTRLIPLGVDKATSSAFRRDGGGNKTPLTITGQSVVIGPNNQRSTSVDYIPDWEYEQAHNVIIEHTERWPTLKTASALYNRGLAFFNEHKLRFSSTVRLTALDVHDLNADIDALEFMTRVYCYSAVHGIGAYYVVRKQRLCLADPSQSEIEIGTETPSLTDLTTATARKSSNTIDAIDDRVFGLEKT